MATIQIKIEGDNVTIDVKNPQIEASQIKFIQLKLKLKM